VNDGCHVDAGGAKPAGGALADRTARARPEGAFAKTSRTIVCKDSLWHALEEAATELDCTVDYLVNDAIKLYVRQRLTRRQGPDSGPLSSGSHAAPPSSGPVSVGPMTPITPRARVASPLSSSALLPMPPSALSSHPLTPSGQFPAPYRPTPASGMPVTRVSLPHAPPSVATGNPAAAPHAPPMPPPLAPPKASQLRAPIAAPTRPAGVPAPRPPMPTPAYIPPGPIGHPQTAQTAPAAKGTGGPPPAPVSRPGLKLTATCGDQTVVVDGPAFVIGRSKSAGLSIRDSNVSRQHALIEHTAGLYFIVDAGSTNGTFVNGERITRRALAEGDVASICDHEIRFHFTK
jgi:hypothetical protein